MTSKATNGRELIVEIVAFLQAAGFDPKLLKTKPACRLHRTVNSVQYVCYVMVRYEISMIVVYFVPPVAVGDRAFFLPVAEFLTRANYGMIFGNFEMDFADGEVRYRKIIRWREEPVAMDEVLDTLESGVSVWGMYLPSLIAIIEDGISAKEALDLI